MNVCGQIECGIPQVGPGRPRKGWIRVEQAGSNRKAVWFCSEACVGAFYAQPVEVPTHTKLALLNRLAGTHLTVMDVTADRLNTALRKAFANLIVEVCRESVRQEQQRPSTVELLNEASA